MSAGWRAFRRETSLRLAGRFPNSVHVREVGLREAADPIVWDHAARHGLAIVAKDADFRQRSFLEGHPPKVLEVDEFLADGQKSFLGLS